MLDWNEIAEVRVHTVGHGSGAVGHGSTPDKDFTTAVAADDENAIRYDAKQHYHYRLLALSDVRGKQPLYLTKGPWDCPTETEDAQDGGSGERA